MPEKIAVILSKDRAANPAHEKLEKELLGALRDWRGVTVTVIPHLYDLAPDGPAIERLRAIEGPMIVLGYLYPRATYWVLDANRVKGRLGPTSSLPDEDYEEPSVLAGDTTPMPQRTIWCFDLRTHDEAAPYLAEMAAIVEAAGVAVEAEAPAGSNGHGQLIDEPTRHRWYPVIDYSRCENCMECLNFCLFGVFGLDARDWIVTEQPDACRPGCPACSRICPKGAIMFPQHHDPAIAGDPKASLEGLKLDLSQLFRGSSAAEIANAERQRYLAEQAQQEAAGKEPPGSSEKKSEPPGQDKLDRLVDEIDDMDL